MTIPIELSFRHLPSCEGLRALVHGRVKRLERIAPDVSSCHIAVGVPAREPASTRGQKRSRARVPGGRLVATRDRAALALRPDVYTATRRAFGAVGRQLQRRAR